MNLANLIDRRQLRSYRCPIMIDYYEPDIDLSLLGCGFLAGYHVGAICLLTQIWPRKSRMRICGASCGGIVAAMVLSGVPLEVPAQIGIEIAMQVLEFIRRPTRTLSIRALLDERVEGSLPANAHELCSGRIGISLTKLWSFQNVLVSEFKTRRDLIDAISAGCFIPLWSGSLTIPTYEGAKCIDGAYSNNVPKFPLTEEERAAGRIQVAVTPFAAEAEVSPPDKHGYSFRVFGTKYYANWNNILRASRALLVFDLQGYFQYFHYGHQDMKEYVLKSNLIKCRQCHLQSSERSPAGRPEMNDNEKCITACLSCLMLLEKVDSLKVSKGLLETYQWL